MHIIIGATGHPGSAVAHTLLGQREPVTVITRDPFRKEKLPLASLLQPLGQLPLLTCSTPPGTAPGTWPRQPPRLA